MARSRRAIRVVIVDDHPPILVGLRVSLERAGIAVVGVAESARDALRLFDDHRPDVALVDYALPDQFGHDLTFLIRHLYPATVVVGMSGYDRPETGQLMRRYGAVEYLHKHAPTDRFVAVIREAAAERCVSRPPRAVEREPTLTPSQDEVLQLVASGRRNREIAGELCISTKTVEFHLRNVFQRLDVDSRTRALAAARERGLLREESAR